jgi:hypothetical protein
MSDYKLGALAPERPFGLSNLATYAVGKIPTPPAKFDVPNAKWQMFLNDTYGDCTIAGIANSMLAWNAEVKENTHIPTDEEVKNTYFGITGGADSGCVEATVLRKFHNEGFFGSKADGYAPVKPHSITQMHQAIAFYGACYVGVALPLSAQQQTQNGQPWTVVPGSPIEGGHCISFVGYDAHAFYAVTWGQIVEVTYPWWSEYGTEAWAIIAPEFVSAGRGPALDLKSLRADLSRI